MSAKYFQESEFTCKCGCLGLIVSNELLNKLDEARALFKKPMVVESGYRCAAHNKAVGGKPTSAHRKGQAADIRCKTDRDRFRLVDTLLAVGFRRVGIGKTFIHADVSDTLPAEVMWLYED